MLKQLRAASSRCCPEQAAIPFHRAVRPGAELPPLRQAVPEQVKRRPRRGAFFVPDDDGLLRIDEEDGPLLNPTMGSENKRLAREQLTMAKMVGLYCSDHHETSTDILCTECQEFLDYAERRLQKCPYGDDKPTCANCPVHCYKPAQRAQAKEIMRYAGPRMLFRHPFLAITHQLDGFRKARHPRELTREERKRSKTG